MWWLLLRMANADSVDSGDSSPYVDSDAKVEVVYTQKDGDCGGGEAAWLLLPLVGVMAQRARRGT